MFRFMFRTQTAMFRFMFRRLKQCSDRERNVQIYFQTPKTMFRTRGQCSDLGRKTLCFTQNGQKTTHAHNVQTPGGNVQIDVQILGTLFRRPGTMFRRRGTMFRPVFRMSGYGAVGCFFTVWKPFSAHRVYLR